MIGRLGSVQFTFHIKSKFSKQKKHPKPVGFSIKIIKFGKAVLWD